MHQYSEDGRDLKIEGFISDSFRFMVGSMFSSKLPAPQSLAFVDIGCDYGFSLDLALKEGFKEAYGLEPNPGTRPDEFLGVLPLIRGQTIEQSDLSFGHLRRVYFLNHVLEHFESPILALKKIYSDPLFAGIFIATPDAENGDKDFVYRGSHLTIFTQDWHKQIGTKLMPAARLVSLSSPTLRDNKKELWAFYAKE